MPRVAVDLSAWKGRIEGWIGEGLSLNDVIHELSTSGMPINKRTLERKLVSWGVSVRAVRGTSNLPQQKDNIISWINEGNTQEEILSLLEQEAQVLISARTLRSKLSQWGVYIQLQVRQDLTLRLLIEEFHFRLRMTDQKMAEVITIEYRAISARQVRRIRKEQGLMKQSRFTPEEEEEYQAEVRTVLIDEYRQGSIDDYGRGLLYAFMRKKYEFIGR